MIVIRATGKAALIHLIDSHFMNWVAIQGNHEKPIREDFFNQIIAGHWRHLSKVAETLPP